MHMKKQMKIISVLLIIMTLVGVLSTISLAAPNLEDKIGSIAEGKDTIQDDKIIELGQAIVTIMQTIGIVVAVVVLLVLGIKYMMGSAEEKAEYKKTMIPYVVGAVLIFASTTIVNIVYQLANSLN